MVSPIYLLNFILKLFSFSAELLLEEKIEYNDLVKSIPDGNSSNDDDHTNIQTVHADKQKDVEPKNGKCKMKLKICLKCRFSSHIRDT